MYYVYHMKLLWPEFVVENMVGLNFCTNCALTIDEVDDKLSQKTSENSHKLSITRCGAASRQLLAKVLQLHMDKAGLFLKYQRLFQIIHKNMQKLTKIQTKISTI